MLAGQHRFEEALAMFEQVLERSPFDATLRGYKGWTHDYLGNHEEALASYSRARAIDASNPFGFLGPGFATAATGELAASADWFERAAMVDPSDAELFAWAALMHLSLDDTASATRAAEHAVELNPLNTVPLAARALVHVFVGEDDRAVEVARRGLLPDVVRRFGNTIALLRILRNELVASDRIDEASMCTRRPSRRSGPRRRSGTSTRSFRSTRLASSPGPPPTSPIFERWQAT